ncbi:hemolysin family protein [Pengzhenrongella sicca]|uniref:HlyC/CorC family transporter n=1 Tax=Pengzhenrongella sicca TaxID=2819238 RepID=A0A8A4ZEI1_9MICO|nr:hemolysin family protein [Pengzhenrongella sicca]QTE28108.1 HlyC/CorC family transporter [Pengzhenrongella sicca]
MWALSLLLGVLVVLAITAVTGYFVAQEFAYMAVDRSRLNVRAAGGDRGATRALAVTRRTSFMLSGAQLGITVTGLLVGYVAEPLIGESLGEGLGGVGVPTGVGIAVGTVLALLFSTFVQMIFGELFPKNLAIARPEPVALWLATSTTVYLKVFGWLIRVFDAASNALLRALGIEPVHDVEHSATARDLEHIVADSRDSGDLPPELSLLLDRIIDFPDRAVEHAMIPRARVDAVRADDTNARVRELMSTGHSRYPVLDDDDQVVGVVHLQDILNGAQVEAAPVTSIMRPAIMVPTSMSLPAGVRTLADSTNQLACVMDEYGGFAGVLTLEDLAEELVGEITDEHDPQTPDRAPVADDGRWVMAGDVHIDEVERAVGHDLPRGDYETIAGLVIAAHGALPDVGTCIVVEFLPDPGHLALAEQPEPVTMGVEVLAVERNVPAVVRVTVPPDPAAPTHPTTEPGEAAPR